MNKQEFLEILGNHLHDLPYADVSDAKQYYDELISDAVESGKDEEAFIASLGIMSEITGRIKAESTVNRAVTKPGMSTWGKALFVILGVCATPIALPIAIALLAVVFAVVVAIIATAIALVAATGGALATAFWLFFTTPLSLSSVGMILTALGFATVVAMGAFYLIRGTFKLLSVMIRRAYRRIMRKRDNKKRQQEGSL